MCPAVSVGTETALARPDWAAYWINRQPPPHARAVRRRPLAALLLAALLLAALLLAALLLVGAGLVWAADAAAQDMTMEELLEELRHAAPQQPNGPPGNGATAPAEPDEPPSISTPVPAPAPQPDPIAPPVPDRAPDRAPDPVPVAVPVPSPAPPTRSQSTSTSTPQSPAPQSPAPQSPAPQSPTPQPPVPQPSPVRDITPLLSPPRPKPRNRANQAQMAARYPWYVQHQIVGPPTPAVRGDIATRLGGPPAPTYPAPSGPQRYPISPYAVPGSSPTRVYPVRGRQPAGYSPVQPVPLPRHVAPAQPGNPANNILVVGPAGTQVARTVAVRAGTAEDNLGPLLQAVRGGILRHDAAFFGNREEKGFDINAEVQFRPFKFMEPIGAPRPILGLSVNLSGATNQLYTGFSWQWEDVIFNNLFMGFSLGFALHDGAKTRFDPADVDKGKEFGLRLLFRESVEIGYRITPKHSLSLMLDHISNANIADANEGLDGLGIRYGHRF